MADIEIAKRVLKREIEGLEALVDWLGDDFVKAVDLIMATKGRVVFSGMGKSGHIGNKISATLASTGQPAYFVHPGEASHGDLGMIGIDDVVVLLSNSGETAELGDIINYCKRFSIPLIGIVRRKTSVLVDAANIALVLPEVPEACSVKAPTTSTTMMLALGDALAVALIERKGFGVEEFNTFHPGGKLGSMFLKVEGVMHGKQECPIVEADKKMSDVLIEMTAKHFGCTSVIDEEGKLIGIITDGDLRRHMSEEIVNTVAKDVMTQKPVTVKKHILASEALALMEDRSITALFITDEEGKPEGILHIHDLLRAGVA